MRARALDSRCRSMQALAPQRIGWESAGDAKKNQPLFR
jgi:hypothetical protein